MTRRPASILGRTLGVAAVACAAGLTDLRAAAQTINETPPELRNVDIIEHLNGSIPQDATFTDEEGKTVRLGDFLKAGRPLILQLGYLRCPMLCNLVLNGAIDGLKEIDFSAGKEFDIVSISINPTEPHGLAKAKRDQYVIEYDRTGGVNGMHFLVGPAEESKKVADAVGFKYELQANGEYAHAAAIFVITPDGRISRYLYGSSFEPKDLRLALLEASEGKIGSTLDRFILWCHVYSPGTGYVLFASRLMQLGGAVTLVALVGGVFLLWRQDVRRRRLAGSTSAPTNS